MPDQDPYRNLLKPPATIEADQCLAGTAMGEIECACPACGHCVVFQAKWYRAFCRKCGQELHRLGPEYASRESAGDVAPTVDRLFWHLS
jgi:uncharacterized protein (DUF983 family)